MHWQYPSGRASVAPRTAQFVLDDKDEDEEGHRLEDGWEDWEGFDVGSVVVADGIVDGIVADADVVVVAAVVVADIDSVPVAVAVAVAVDSVSCDWFLLPLSSLSSFVCLPSISVLRASRTSLTNHSSNPKGFKTSTAVSRPLHSWTHHLVSPLVELGGSAPVFLAGDDRLLALAAVAAAIDDVNGDRVRRVESASAP